MTEHVTIDAGKPTCLGVHYAVTIGDAIAHFEDEGFRGISGMGRFEQALDCNEARRRALDAAKRGEGRCWWSGAWDYSVQPCTIWRFDYTSYDGPTFSGPRTPDTEAHVDWKEE